MPLTRSVHAEPPPRNDAADARSVAILTLVRPDFLPSVYAISEVLGEKGYQVEVFCFGSPVPGERQDGANVRLHDLGLHGGSNAVSRHRARRRFRSAVDAWASQHECSAVMGRYVSDRRHSGDGGITNSVNMTIPGELYLKFGWTGVLFGCLLFGVFLRALWDRARFWDGARNTLGTAFGFYLLWVWIALSLGPDLQWS